MNQILDGSVTASQAFVNYMREEPDQYMIKVQRKLTFLKLMLNS